MNKGTQRKMQPLLFSKFSLPGKHMQKLLSGAINIITDAEKELRGPRKGFVRQGGQEKQL